jgi:UTP:GlnB (protein PII) uridylyltransferase
MPSPMLAAMEPVILPAFAGRRSVGDEPCGRRTPASAASLTTTLRRELRASAGDLARRSDRQALHARIGPIVNAAVAELREWRAAGTGDRQLALVWGRLVDAAVMEAYRLARFQSGGHPIVAPLTTVAVGAYGEQELLPEQAAGLLSIVPPDGRELAGRRMAHHLVENLEALGLAIDHSTAAPGACVAFARDYPRVAVMLSTGRHLAGSYARWATIRERAAS